MIEKVAEPVTVHTVYRPDRKVALPWRMEWRHRDYTFNKVDLCHPVWEGKTLHHVYSVSDGKSYFRLDFNTRSTGWTLEEVADGLPN